MLIKGQYNINNGSYAKLMIIMFTCVFSGMQTRYSNQYWGKKMILTDIIQIHRFCINPSFN